MKTAPYLFSLLALLALASCQSDNRPNTEGNENEQVNTEQDTPIKLIEYLIGDWEMTGTGEGRSAPGQANPGDRLTFTSEARYVSYEGNQKVDSGAYRMNQQLRHIYLESEVNETPREYDIDIQSDRMTLKPVETNTQEGGGEFVYRRIGPASIPPDKSDEAQQ